MNAEHTRKLVEDFPELYWQINLSMTETAMMWGFECGDGWYDLLYELSSKLKPLVQALNLDREYKCGVVQVKEKYGTLRYYTDFSTEEIDNLIDEYETKSGETCEVCGKPGVLRGGGWYYTACDEHLKERDR